MKKIALISMLMAIIIPSCSMQFKKRSGIVDRIQGQNIYVRYDNPAKPFAAGEILRINLDADIVHLNVIASMKTVAKCSLAAADINKIDLIKKGMIVYFDKAASGTKIQVSKSEPEEYTIGDYGPSGGVIFYDKGNSNGGWRYLEAAPDDQSNGIQWVNESYQYIGMTGTRIGTGRANTKKIVAVQGDGTYAAKICADYQGGGRSDWFLPSKDELAAMRTVLTEIQVKGFAGEFYWSSSEVDGSLAWLQVSKSNNQYGDGKDYTAHVRAIRAF